MSSVRFDDVVQTSLSPLSPDGSEWVVPSVTTWNASVAYRFASWRDSTTRVHLGINNFTDERVPMADRFFGFFAHILRDLGLNCYLDLK